MTKAGLPALGLLALLTSLPSCRKGETSTGKVAGPPPVIAPEIKVNQMANGPQGLLASRKDSPVHWQNWEPEVLKRAGEAKRLVAVFFASAQYPGCLDALDFIDRDPKLVARLNEEFVPVLADPSVHRECGILNALLGEENKAHVVFPYLLILTPEGNEVAWRPVPFSPGSEFREVFDKATDLVASMWKSDPEFTFRNSKADHDMRVNRILPADAVADTTARDAFLIRATRQLNSQYEPDIGVISGSGGLLPLGILQCLATSANDPAVPKDVAKRSREAVTAFSKHVLQSAMVDPLDGGVYSVRLGNSWDLPVSQRTCMTQARAARALVSLHASTGDPRPLEVARGAVKFAEEQFATPDGLFSDQRQPAPDRQREMMWTLEQLEAALTPQEAALWKALSKFRDLGNLPMEADPMRQYFRMNSLSLGVPLAEAAAKANVDASQAATLFESSRKKLLDARLARSPQPPPAAVGTAAPSFRMVSAYVALFTATGEAAWRDKALKLAKQARETFSKENLLVEQGPPVPEAVGDARAFTYAMATQAALDLAEVTLDENWRLWAGDLVTVVAEQFTDKTGRLLEARPASAVTSLPLADRVMLFDDSTAGLMRMNVARLDALGQPPPPEMTKLARSLPPIQSQPVVMTDTILAASFGRSRIIVELPVNPSAEWRDAAAKLPLDRIARRIGRENKVKVIRPDGSIVTPANPAELAAAIATTGP